jgi:hypothetical protein
MIKANASQPLPTPFPRTLRMWPTAIPVLGTLLFAAAIAIHRRLLLAAGKRRKRIVRYELEHEVLEGNRVRHEEEYVAAPGRSGQVLYRQIWSPVGGRAIAKGVVVFVHGIHAYGGRFAKDAVVITLFE